MTREQALDELSVLSERMDDTEDYTYTSDISVEAIDIAIESLSAEPCDDAISRWEVMDFIRGLTRWCVRSEDGKFNNVGLLYDDVMFGLDRLPSVTPKQKMGRWIKANPWTKPYCSECGESCFGVHGFDCITTDFCPMCGARMAESEDE